MCVCVCVCVYACVCVCVIHLSDHQGSQPKQLAPPFCALPWSSTAPPAGKENFQQHQRKFLPRSLPPSLPRPPTDPHPPPPPHTPPPHTPTHTHSPPNSPCAPCTCRGSAETSQSSPPPQTHSVPAGTAAIHCRTAFQTLTLTSVFRVLSISSAFFLASYRLHLCRFVCRLIRQ